jgi:soluble cytochrome b562
MKRHMIIIAAFLFAFIFTAQSYADYDTSAVRTIMRNNYDTLNLLKKAVKAEDFQNAEQAFKTIANGMQPLLKMTPPRGSKSEWDASINQFIAAAVTGAKVSSERNIDKVKKALDDLQAIMKKGHSEFK